MPLELESYLNVPRISEIEPFPAAYGSGKRFTYIISRDGRAARRGGEHRGCAARPFLVLSRRRDKPRVEIFFDRFPPPSPYLPAYLARGTFRVFMIGIRGMQRGSRLGESGWNVSLRYDALIKALSVPLSTTNLRRGSVIYDYHCNEGPWVFAQQIVLPCAHKYEYAFSGPKYYGDVTWGISAHDAEYHRGPRFIATL